MKLNKKIKESTAIEDSIKRLDDIYSNRCGYCKCAMDEEDDSVSLGIEIDQTGKLDELQGLLLFVRVNGVAHKVPCVVAGEGSDAKAQGFDVVFRLCGIRCLNRLQKALNAGFDIMVPKAFMPSAAETARVLH